MGKLLALLSFSFFLHHKRRVTPPRALARVWCENIYFVNCNAFLPHSQCTFYFTIFFTVCSYRGVDCSAFLWLGKIFLKINGEATHLNMSSPVNFQFIPFDPGPFYSEYSLIHINSLICKDKLLPFFFPLICRSLSGKRKGTSWLIKWLCEAWCRVSTLWISVTCWALSPITPVHFGKFLEVISLSHVSCTSSHHPTASLHAEQLEPAHPAGLGSFTVLH